MIPAALRFEPPTVQQRGMKARAIAAVKKLHCPPPRYCPPKDVHGKETCECGGTITYFVRAANGLSNGRCGRCGISWSE